MNETIKLITVGMMGVALGAMFFGGLLWTIRRAIGSPYAAVWFLTSLMLRMSITLAGFYWVAQRDGPRLIACLVGFFMGRLIVTWLTRPLPEVLRAS